MGIIKKIIYWFLVNRVVNILQFIVLVSRFLLYPILIAMIDIVYRILGFVHLISIRVDDVLTSIYVYFFLLYKGNTKVFALLAPVAYVFVVMGLICTNVGGIGLEPVVVDQADKVLEGFLSHEKMVDPFAKEYQEFKLQEEPLKQEPPADTRGGFLIFCASAGLFIAVRLYFG